MLVEERGRLSCVINNLLVISRPEGRGQVVEVSEFATGTTQQSIEFCRGLQHPIDIIQVVNPVGQLLQQLEKLLLAKQAIGIRASGHEICMYAGQRRLVEAATI